MIQNKLEITYFEHTLLSTHFAVQDNHTFYN